jgi:hypothetical protein
MVPSQEVDSVPRLVVTSPGRWQNTYMDLAGRHLLLGRAETADIHLDDPTISRRHALIERSERQTFVTDLGSTGGTTVNGVPARSAVELHDGDVVAFASILTRYEGRVVRPPPPIQPGAGAQFTVGLQNAQQLSNIGRDQYNQYLQTIYAQRASFLREVAASHTRARRLIWFGFLLFVAGGGAFMWTVIRFISRVSDLEPAEQPSPSELWGEDVGGVPLGFIGFGIAFVGVVTMITGIVLHVVATSRQRRIESQPLLPPGVPGAPLPPPRAR